MTAMRFFSDNAAAVHPAVMEALAAANHVDTAYDGDALSQSLDAAFSDLFETTCEVVWISTGTAANSIILGHFVRPWQGILCYEEAHIEVDECGAPTFYSGGAKLMTLPGTGAKIDADALKARIAGIRAPTLVVHATDDTLQLYRNAAFAATHIPGARLLRFERGGHLLIAVEQPGIRAEVQAFIRSHSAHRGEQQAPGPGK